MFQYDVNEIRSKPLSDRSNKQSKQMTTTDDGMEMSIFDGTC